MPHAACRMPHAACRMPQAVLLWQATTNLIRSNQAALAEFCAVVELKAFAAQQLAGNADKTGRTRLSPS